MPNIPVGNGKRGVAPCGHAGVYVIGQYVQCLQSCESRAEEAPAIEHCPRCGESEIDFEYALDPVYLMWNPGTASFDRRCWECGHLWTSP